MTLVNRIENRVKEYLNGDYLLREEDSIPRLYNVHSGKRAHKTKACAFYIDLRNSTKLLFTKGKATSGKVHKAFLNAVSEVVEYYNGEIRDFQGDGLLAFWNANDINNLSKAVRAGFLINWFFTKKLKDDFEPYGGIDFGIGIDWGDIYILRVGIRPSECNNDLVYIGKCVNFAVGIANRLSKPNCIGISQSLYSNLEEDKIYKINGDEKKNMWNKYTFKWKDDEVEIYRTGYYWGL